VTTYGEWHAKELAIFVEHLGYHRRGLARREQKFRRAHGQERQDRHAGRVEKWHVS